jgi:hypothetical protein
MCPDRLLFFILFFCIYLQLTNATLFSRNVLIHRPIETFALTLCLMHVLNTSDISFDIFPTNMLASTMSILHLTWTGNDDEPGGRIPCLYFIVSEKCINFDDVY